MIANLRTKEGRDGLAKVTATAFKTEPIPKEAIMDEPIETFTTSLYGHEIHGLMVDIFSHWSKESVTFPASERTAKDPASHR
ncbi:hypothetical protein [Citricoccus sp.]|uniref:hypothetical protein n=1 Tax=Citricoccus sp. TaxID=1978372 RepID=UPI0028BEA63B|nr:hypothetical protein [Citricoccus sp.]